MEGNHPSDSPTELEMEIETEALGKAIEIEETSPSIHHVILDYKMSIS
jgi:hypothetical protein